MQCERTCSSGNITQGREIIGNCLFNTFSVRILLKQLLFDLDFYVLIVDEAQHIIYCSLMRTSYHTYIVRTSYYTQHLVGSLFLIYCVTASATRDLEQKPLQTCQNMAHT